MKTFKDLEFTTHPVTKKGISAKLEIKPDVFLSVIAGPGFYSTPGGLGADEDKFKDKPDVSDFSSFEVAIITQKVGEADDINVIGWQSRGDINTLILTTTNE